MRGPIDYIIVGFEGNNFTGEILQELEKAVRSGAINVLDLMVISRDGEGNVGAIELANIEDPDTAELTHNLDLKGGLITEEDVAEVGDLLEDNTSAGLLIVEHLWAKGLKQAIINANGTLLADGRIHPDAAVELDEGGK